MRKQVTDYQRWITVALVIVGYLAMTQFRTVQTATGVEPSKLRSESILTTLVQVEQDNYALQRESADLQQRIRQFEQAKNINEALMREKQEAELRAGLTGLKGPGMTVVLSDSQLPREAGIDPNNYYIHESFLRSVVNAFWTGGAEGVAINGQRLISTSEIFCGGTTIFINGENVAPPYVIQAIGDPRALRTSLDIDALPLLTNLQRDYGIGLDVREEKEIRLPPYQKKVDFKYARPVREGE
ncbi:Uncharacterized conserved protein YlxW, UPF0749 family [Carboxydocella sporoproducens DSM 16521]|uniref:Uncharacterized conserved protein YlxW, UPF0749 family n=2 Tax=Carboxydocella TaxID=178898 RepID=A0A1T4M3T9_9FIRM|nr:MULTISPECIES: DUF881 domain-containing protein [Carboxydocella]AVX21056.1 Uncharacterized conserved protein YlxW, UPF0749 family [Carboxydocella thermautotrophica]SJZ61633.1 Uncharacterized conserved protein YlxW, UPF0749 family [Carboxydocella sporoproducens DSM 16521]